MHFGNRLRAVALAFVIPFAIVACGPNGGGGPVSVLPSTSYTAQNPTDAQKGGQLLYSHWEAVNNLFGVSSSAATISQATTMLRRALWTYDPTNVPVPDLVSQVPPTDHGGHQATAGTHQERN